MKRKLLPLFALLLLSFSNSAHNLNAFFSSSAFDSPKGPYVETYLDVVGNSIKLMKNDAGKFQGKVEVELTFTKDSAIKYHDKYNLLSPALDDSDGYLPDFIDQQRILLPNGNYDLLLKISDKFLPEQTITAHYAVKINFPKDSVSISDIELVDSTSQANQENALTKSGLNIIPFVSDYYPKGKTMLKFYAEIYNTKNVLKDDPFLINYYVSDKDSKYVVHNLAGFRKETPQDVCVILAQIPLQDLPSGNYVLTVTIRNKNNILLAARQVFFQRSNVKSVVRDTGDIKTIDVSNTFAAYITSKDTLQDYIESLHPISTRNEAVFEETEIQIADLKYMQQFFYDFWVKRDASNPEKAWRDYLTEVNKVNAMYSTRMMKGYGTDRGRVYLQYGPPTSIYREENDPGNYPYEIWHYYKLGTQSNRKFLFYCRDSSTNLYTLLHSDANGETYNPEWQQDLRSQSPGGNLNQTTSPGGTGGRALEEFNNPK